MNVLLEPEDLQPSNQTNGLHPLFASILGTATDRMLADTRAAQVAEYAKLLAGMDWSYEFADDFSAYKRGQQTLVKIRALQPYVDADQSIFNAARPGRFGDARL